MSALWTRHEKIFFPVTVALVMRVGLSLFGAWVVAWSPRAIEPRFETQWQGMTPLSPVGINLFAAPFQRWDALWYQVIAARGYSANDMSAAFFPLFPLLTRVFAFGTGATIFVGMILATLCTTAAFILFYQLAQNLFDQRAARLGLVAWATFPTAFFLFVPYAEALFVLCALCALTSARQGKWLLAGASGGLAALTRSPGVWLVVPLGVEWLQQNVKRARQTRISSGLFLLLVPLGIMSYMFFLQARFGDMLLWMRALSVWDNRFSPPWETLALTVRAIILGDRGALANNLLDFGATLFVLGMVLWGLLPENLSQLSTRGWKPRLPFSLGAYGLVFIFLPLSLVAHASNFELVPMASAARRAVVIFPAFLAAGVVLQGRVRAPLYFAAALALQLILVYVFVNWLWVA